VQERIKSEASALIGRFGPRAFVEARQLLDSATAARDHKAGMFYAEVCRVLQNER
jgi:hypothetical protein